MRFATLYFWLALILFVSSELVVVLIFFWLSVQNSSCSCFWSYAGCVGSCYHSGVAASLFKRISLGTAAFVQHRLKLPLLAFSALHSFWFLSLLINKGRHSQMFAFHWWCISVGWGTGCDGASSVVTLSLEKPYFQVVSRTELAF